MPDPLALKVTVVDGATALRIPCRMVVPVVVAPLAPCQEMVQPPDCNPMLLALLPATKIRLAFFGSGSTPVFLSSTWYSRTACRARDRYAALPTDGVKLRSVS